MEDTKSRLDLTVTVTVPIDLEAWERVYESRDDAEEIEPQVRRTAEILTRSYYDREGVLAEDPPEEQ